MIPVEPLEALGRHVAQREQALADPSAEHERLKVALLARARTAKRPRTRLPVAFRLSAALGVAAVIAIYLTRSSPSDLSCFVGGGTSLASVGSWMSAPATDPLKLRFSDGSRVSLWPRARGRITRLSPNGADLVVEQGRASFAVVHQARSHWQVSTGPFVVQVTGTSFEVEWQPEADHFELSLFEGHVRVLGCGLGDGQDLIAGQRIEASCARKEYKISAVPEEPTHAATAMQTGDDASVGRAAPPSRLSELRGDLAQRASNPPSAFAGSPPDAAPPTPASAPMRAREAMSNWITLARAGRFADAYDAALSADFDGECLARGAPEVLLLGDAARLSGHMDRARQAYLAVRRRWPGSAGAALAAFQLGRTEFDQRQAFGEAETWLRAYLREQPNGEFGAPAMGRLMEAEIHLNHYESARNIAKSYLDRYPKGAHAVAAQQVLDASPTSDH